MVRIIYGKAKSGKTHRLFTEINACISRGEEGLILLVPEQYTLEAEKQLMAFMGAEGLLNIEVLSFKRLAHKVISEEGSPEKNSLSTAGKIMLLRKIFFESRDALNVYKSAYDKMGFLSQVLDLIKEFKQNMVAPEKLNAIGEGLEGNPLLKAKLEDFSTVFNAYETMKSDRYQDEEDLYAHLLACIATSDKLKGMKLWIDGFDSFTVQELGIIKALMTTVSSLSLSLCFEPNAPIDVYAHTSGFFRKFHEASKEVGVPFEQILCEWKGVESDFEHIAEQLQAYPYNKRHVDGAKVRVFAADSRESEVSFCASEMMSRVMAEGYTWQDFAVITNGLEAYEMNIKNVFDEIGIPFFLDVVNSTRSNPLVHLILSYLKIYEARFTPDSVAHFVKSMFFYDDFTDICCFENYIKSNGIRHKKINNPFEIACEYGCDLENLEAIRIKLIALFKDGLTKSETKVSDVVITVYDMLKALDVQSKIAKQIDRFNNERNYDQSQQYAQIWNKTMSLFDQLVDLMGDEHLPITQLIHVMSEGFEAMEIGRLPQDENCVLVGSIDRSRAHPIKAMFFIGFNDGIIPELGSDRQLLSDAEKNQFIQMGLEIVADDKMFADKEQFNIYHALTRPSNQLYFTYARSDAEGSALRPSFFITKLLKIAPNLKHEDERLSELAIKQKLLGKTATLKNLAVEMRRSVDGYPIHEVWPVVFGWYRENMAEKAELLIRGLRHKNTTENLNEAAVEALFGSPIKTSVSRLEEYVQCPFKYFVNAGLQPINDKKYELTAPDIGTFFHKALEIFGQRIYSEGIQWQEMSQDAVYGLMEEVVEGITQRAIFEDRFQYRYLVNKLKRVSKKAAWTLTRQLTAGTFKPVAFEVAFGQDKESVAPILIQLDQGKSMLIRGVIDRVDQVSIDDRHYVRIIDYKSGSKSLNLSDIYNGLQMQLMVYLSACLENPDYFRLPSIAPAGAFYFRIDDPLIESTEELPENIDKAVFESLKMDGVALDDSEVLKQFDDGLYDALKSSVVQVRLKKDGDFTKDSKVVSEEVFMAMIDHVKTRIVGIGNELMTGRIDIAPCKVKAFVSCQYCDYQALCQFDPQTDGKAYNKLETYSNEEVIDKIKGNRNG